MVETIYIARHGYRMNWVTTNWVSKTGLPRDPPLAAFGENQAKELAQYFLTLPEELRPSAIFSSPYYRCLQTAVPTADALGLPLYVEHGLSEWYSPVQEGTGLHPRPASAEALRSHFPQIDPVWSSVWYPSRKGETVEEAHDRAKGFLQEFKTRLDRRFQERHSRVLFVSHAATVITLTRELIGDRELPLRIGCCSLTELKSNREKVMFIGGYEATKLASGDHLDGGASRDWGFEDIVIKDGKVVNDVGVPGSQSESDEPVGAVTEEEPAAKM